MYGRRGKYGQHANSVDLVANTSFEHMLWTMGLKLIRQKAANPEEAFIQKAYRELRRPKLNLHETMELLAKINFKAPKKFVAEKFAVRI
jgi:hypothetical protein